jgi:hypothetical protein
MKLYEYAIIWEPTEAQAKEGQKPKLVLDVTRTLATDEKSANIIASRAIPDEYVMQLDQIKIALRPF